MSVTDRNNLGFDYESPAYRFGSLETQANNCLSVPIVYGKARAAGNKIWQSSGTTSFNALVCFAEGKITGFSDIRINDILITDSALNGCTYTAYLGDGVQQIDDRVPGDTQADKAELVGGLKYTAYLALRIKSGLKVASNYMDVSAVLQGKAVRIYTNTSAYTTMYSNNPIWCILDFLTCYNGCGLSYSNIDIQSFIDAASYCDEKINPVNATGTVSVTSGSKTVTGSGTKFKNEVKVGDQVTINGESKDVTEVSSDTSLTVASNFSSTASSQTMVVKDTRYALNIILDTRKTRQDWLNEMLICCRGFLKYNGSKASITIEQDATSVQSFAQDDIIADSEVFWTTPKEQRCDIFKIRYMDPDNQYARAYAVAEADTFLNDPPIIQEIVALGITSFKQASRLAWFYLNQANTCDKFFSFMTTKKALDRTPGDIIDLTSTFMGYENKKMVVVSMNETQEGQIQLICREFNSALYADTLGSVAPVFNTVNLTDVLDTPDDVQNLASAQNLNSIILTWQPISNPIATYEIREGTSWSESRLIAKDLTGSSYTVLNIQKGTFKYWICAVNKYGNYSANPKLSTIVVSDIQEVNTILNENIFDDDLSAGTFVNCYGVYNRVALDSVDTWTSSGTWDDAGKDYAPDGYWGSEVESTGSYTTKVYDIGTNLTSIISVNYDLSSRDDASNIIVEWKYSEDNITWTDWQIFSQGSSTFRYYQFKITLNSPNNSYTAVSNFIVNIDVPDRDFYFEDQVISVAANGVTVNFDPAYANIPAVVANISDGTNGYCVVTSKTTSQATVKAYNNSGIAITAQVDIRVKGY
ncbi:MAG TPA: phage tail protein [Candidatus Gastranaerophilales bacterium]|nr:phage tail protein [Candidatus Gastranaerophilales bacterium]